jgi:hypothetical protein
MKLAAILFTLAVSASAGATAADKTSPATYGHLAKEGTASRVIKISPSTRAINVHDGETVRFNVNGKIFEWTFNIPTRDGVISFSDVAPTETGAGNVQVYVSPNPLYFG